MLDFGARPPEVNSALMYSGPGSGAMVAAASAWSALAAELNSAALNSDSVITAVTSEEWLGPASASMAAAATPYVEWLSNAAAQAEQAATQARAAAAAYEAAFSAMVPPPVIAANRALVSQLMATNVLGQNTPAIAAAEAQYGEMWAQDAATMYAYAGSSATAVQMTQFTAPAQIANPAGQTMQATAVTQAVGSSAGTSAQSTLSQAMSSLPSTLQSLAAPVAATPAGSASASSPIAKVFDYVFGAGAYPPTSLSNLINEYNPYSSLFYNTEGLPYFSVGMSNFGVAIARNLGVIGGSSGAAAAGGAAGGAAGAAAGLGGGLGGGLGSGVAAGLGNAGAVGRLSVPAAWGGAPAVNAPAAPLPISSVSAAPEAGGPGSLLGGMPLAGAGLGASGAGPKYGFRPTVMARPPFAG